MIEVVEVGHRRELTNFVKFPFTLYKDSKNWVPPIIKQELDTFDKTKNPVFSNADAWFFLAYKDQKIAGRVVVIINWNEVKGQGLKKIRFGWFDVIDDVNVTKALLTKVKEIGIQHDLKYMEGPMGFSNFDKVGVQTEGFEYMGNMITWYNHPYYSKHFEILGLDKEKEFLENKFSFSDVDPILFEKANVLIKKRYGLNALSFSSSKDIMKHADKMFELYNQTYAKLSSFVPISVIQREYFKKKYIPFINPEYIFFIEDSEQNLVAFAIVMPSYSEALQKARGRLFPFGYIHFLRARKNTKDVLFYLIGIHPDYQNKGVTAIVFDYYYKVFSKKGIKTCIRTPELEENKAIHQMWKHFNQSTYARRRTYRIELDNFQ